MNPVFVIIPVVWTVGAFFAWAFVHGAKILRQEEDSLLGAGLEPVLGSAQQ